MSAKLTRKLVMIGNGMAGMRVMDELLALDTEHQYDITIIGAEPHGNYNRIMLSPVLAGDKTVEDIILHPLAWYAENNIRLIAGDPATHIDRVKRVITTLRGEVVAYDRLLIATGSQPFIIPVPGHDLPGVIGFRDIHDVESMLDVSRSDKQHAVVIGAGLLGLEAAYGLLKRGMSVSVVHLSEYILNQQLDATASKMLQADLAQRGITFHMNANTQAILGDTCVTGLAFADGSEIPADLVVMAAGIRPNIALAKDAGLQVDRAILVNDTLQTYDPAIYAVGECAQHRGMAYGLVAPLYEQAKICAQQLAGLGYWAYAGSVTATSLKVSGVNLYSAGDFNNDTAEIITYHDPEQQVYKRLNIIDGKLTGLVLYGDIADGPWYFDLLQSQTVIGNARDRLVFGRSYAEPQLSMALQ